jgi:hypothetical protein
MEFHPLRALITRDDDGDPRHEPLRDVPATIPSEPEVGLSLRVYLDSGKLMQTSAVKHIDRHGSELVVDTANSRYRLKLSQAA